MKKTIFVIIVILLLITGFTGCTNINETKKNGNDKNIDVNSPIEITNYIIGGELDYIDGNLRVLGTAKNTADEMHYVTITGKFYDENHTFIGNDFSASGRNNVNCKVYAGYSWDFMLLYPHWELVDRVKTVEFEISYT
jgi:hypothetical protein